jgi:hypothetical protein
MPGEIYELKCDMEKGCTSPVTMLDNKGYIYCASHGLQRRSYGTPCRKLTSSEIKGLKHGESVKRY